MVLYTSNFFCTCNLINKKNIKKGEKNIYCGICLFFYHLKIRLHELNY